MTETELSDFCEFIKIWLVELPCSEGTHANLRFPDFEHMPHDYLKFAENALLRNDESGHLDCIGHLKRALECEIDTFLEILGLKKERKRMNLPKKLSFLEKIGIIPSRMLARMNQARNRAEHEYAKVSKSNVEQHFDLVFAAVKAVEGAIFMLSTAEDFQMWSEEETGVGLAAHYDFDKPSIGYRWNDKSRDGCVKVDSLDWDDFQDALNIYFLLIMSQAIVSPEYVADHLPRRHITNAVKGRS